MPKIIFIFLFISCLSLISSAQDLPCATQLSPKQLQDLRNFQQKLASNQVGFLNKSTQFVPLKIHIIGDDRGMGYYSISNLMQALCEINQRFAPVGFHFYLAENVSYINDNALHRGDLDAIFERAFDYKLSNAVNIFFHNAGNQWCGVYVGGVDVIFIKNACQAPAATTLAHELGHFFGLPHTFLGWEGGNTPSPSQIERLDGSNCRSAGDGFCDTKADYVAQRWSCPLPWNLQDPSGISFKPDSSLYMNYASDACHSRFSGEQILAMRNDLQQRRIAQASANTDVLQAPIKISPANTDTNIISKNIPFTWRSVPGAFAYQLQIARFGDWNFLNYNQLLTDTFALVDLFGNWPFAWRIKAISNGNTCSSFGSADTFYTREIAAGIQTSFFRAEPNFYPNPVAAGSQLFIQNLSDGKLELFDSKGELKLTQVFDKNLSFTVPNLATGMYILKWQTHLGIKFQRLMITEN